jgi:hypothetical protein
MRWGGSYSLRTPQVCGPTRYGLLSLGTHRGNIAGRDLSHVMYPRPLRFFR